MDTLTQDSLQEDILSHIHAGKIKLAWRISFLFLVVFFLLTFAYYYDSRESFYTMISGVVISLFCLAVMYFKTNYLFVFYVYSYLGVLVTSYALINFHETIHFVEFLWLLAAVSLSFFAIGKKTGIMLLTSSLAAIVYFMFFSLNKNIETVNPRNTYQKFSLSIELLSGFISNIYLFLYFLEFYRFSNEKLVNFNQELMLKHQLIKAQNDEKTVLVKEIHHRVKNNLQIIISMLRLQSMESSNQEVKNEFNEAVSRILVMSHIHTRLYQQDSLFKIDLDEYLRDLVKDLMQIAPDSVSIDCKIFCDIEQVELKTIIPLGLIINELISNSIKHAFKTGIGNIINLSVLQENDLIRINYSDNGKWIVPKNPGSFGLILIDTLIEQLDGTKRIETSDKGTFYKIHVKNLQENAHPGTYFSELN